MKANLRYSNACMGNYYAYIRFCDFGKAYFCLAKLVVDKLVDKAVF